MKVEPSLAKSEKTELSSGHINCDTVNEIKEDNKTAVQFTKRPLTTDKPADRKAIWHRCRRPI